MSQDFLDKLFVKARSHNNWKNKDIDKKILENLYYLIKNCPTSANSEPMRIIFLKSKESKERIKSHLSEGKVWIDERAKVSDENKNKRIWKEGWGIFFWAFFIAIIVLIMFAQD